MRVLAQMWARANRLSPESRLSRSSSAARGNGPGPGSRLGLIPRLRASLAVGATAVALLAGCGNPGNVDGLLVDDWAPVAAPTGFTPLAGVCHLAAFADVGTRETYETVDCDAQHRTETVYVGVYPTAAAGSPEPPTKGSAGAVAAYQECDTRTSSYVGAPWRTGRLWIGVVQPSAKAWAGGARWYRCEVIEISSIEDDGGLVQRSGSLRDTLASSASPLRLTCYAIKLDTAGAIDTMPAASCVTRHNAEFVGVWDAGKLPYPSAGTQWTKFHDGCRKLIATYVGVPDDANLEFRTGVVSLPGGPDVWAAGDHEVRCYLWLDAAKLTTSLKGKGAKSLPVQYSK
jgi:hypothetical protein